jgi:putative ABC transport system permease protein
MIVNPNESPVGEQVGIRNTTFTIVGVLKAKGEGGMGNDQDDLIMAPSTTVFRRLKVEQFVDMIHANAASTETMTNAQGEIKRILQPESTGSDGTLRACKWSMLSLIAGRGIC